MSTLALLAGVSLGFGIYYAYVTIFPRLQTPSVSNQDVNRLPPGMTAESACKGLQKKYGLGVGSEISQVSPSVRYHWTRLKCLENLQPAPKEIPEKKVLIGPNPIILSEPSLERHEQPQQVDNVDETRIVETKTRGKLGNQELNPPLKRPGDALTPKEECVKWEQTYHVIPGSSWGMLPEPLQKAWSRNNCDKLVEEAESEADKEEYEEDPAQQTVGLGVTKISPAIEVPTEEDVTKLLTSKKNKKKASLKKGASETSALPNLAAESADWCVQARAKYEVVPMKTWGKLPLNLVDVWKSKRCDLVFTAARMGKKHLSSCPLPPEVESVYGNKGSGGSMTGQLKSAFLALTKGGANNGGTSDMVTPDAALSAGRKSATSDSPAAKLLAATTLTSPEAREKLAALAPYFNSLPLISILAATTTRKIKDPSPENLALFTFMLPSLIRTLDCGFRYEYVLGYDVGDPFYDSEEGLGKAKRWFRDNVELPMLSNNIVLTLRTVRVNNSIKKPGPVFIAMARAAFDNGAEYFYRINDDTEHTAHWPSIFVNSLKSLDLPYGVVGPKCTQGNQKILTHDFVHRTHMEIFEMNYYPPELTDWWMDDWISWVYGKERTFKAKDVPVIHHTGAHGQRYEVDRSHEHLLDRLVEDGHKKIREWMLKHAVSQESLVKFDKDEYKVGFKHKDVPHNVAS